MKTTKPPCVLLLSAQLFVITHGWQYDKKFPTWVSDLATAINSTLDKPSTPEQIQASIVDSTAFISRKSSPHFILFNWAQDSWERVGQDKIAGGLHSAIKRKIGNRKVDIHFIGHSRGCYVNAATIKRIAEAGDNSLVGFLRSTTLDPRTLRLINDGTLSANPGGIVDWADNFYQKTSREPLELALPVNGLILHPDALNVNLGPVVTMWSGRTQKTVKKGLENHWEVHDWYHWTWDQKDFGDLKETPYSDFDINKQRTTFFAEKARGNMVTRQKLYWTSPIVENFRGGITPEFQFFSGRGSNLQRVPRIIHERDVNAVMDGYLQLNYLKQWISTGTWFLGGFRGGFTAEFTFQICDRNYHSSADGITFTMLDANKPLRLPLGRIGGELGYGGLNGLAIAFDTFSNPEYKDPRITNRTVSLRANGLPQWLEPFTPDLPEPVNSGGKFRVRISVSDEADQISLRIYSYGTDQVATMTKSLPRGSIPRNKIVGFTSATGEGAAKFRIEEVILMTSPIRAFSR